MAYDSKTYTISVTGSVSISDVKSALQETTNHLAQLCKSPNINIWSRFKPIRDPDPTMDITANSNYTVKKQTFYDLNSEYYGNGIGNCGLNINPYSYNAIGKMIDMTTPTTDWEYLRPTGVRDYITPSKTYAPGHELTTPYRLGDFRGYKANALCPFPDVNIPSILPKTGDYSIEHIWKIKPAITPTTEPGAIQLDELKVNGVPLSNYYFCVFLFPMKDGKLDTTQHPQFFCAESPGGFSLTISMWPGLKIDDEFIILPALTNQSGSAPGTTGRHFISIPTSPASTVKIGSAEDASGIIISSMQTRDKDNVGPLFNGAYLTGEFECIDMLGANSRKVSDINVTWHLVGGTTTTKKLLDDFYMTQKGQKMSFSARYSWGTGPRATAVTVSYKVDEKKTYSKQIAVMAQTNGSPELVVQ